MLLYILIALGLVAATAPQDPAPSLVRSKTDSRQLECERLDVQTGSEERPGQIAPTKPRGEFQDRSAVLCQERFVRSGLRKAQDEAVLRELEGTASSLAGAAVAEHPELDGRTWLVEVHYGHGDVAHKVDFATKNALVAQGVPVSDRMPRLGAGDVEVLTRLEPLEAYPAACRRYADNGSLGSADALLAVVSLDRRSAELHAGTCVDGAWSWLR